MTTPAPTFHPPYAVICWCDDNWIYVEVPCKEGPPLITKWELTDGGLSRALKLMRDSRIKHVQITGTHSFLQAEPKVYRKPGSFSEAQRKGAAELLRKLGVTKR